MLVYTTAYGMARLSDTALVGTMLTKCMADRIQRLWGTAPTGYRTYRIPLVEDSDCYRVIVLIAMLCLRVLVATTVIALAVGSLLSWSCGGVFIHSHCMARA